MRAFILDKIVTFLKMNPHVLLIVVALIILITSFGVPLREFVGGCGGEDSSQAPDEKSGIEEIFSRPGIEEGGEKFETLKMQASRNATVCSDEDIYVPQTFEPLTANYNRTRSSDVGINLWGREYIFRRGPLPISIRSQGIDIFSSSPVYNLSVNGSPTQLNWSYPIVTKACPAIVQLMTYANIINSNRSRVIGRMLGYSRIEYDGMIKVEYRIVAYTSFQITDWEYKFQIRDEVAKYYNRHFTYDWSRNEADNHLPFSHPLGPVASTFPQRLELPFVPTVHIGNENISFEWLTETDVKWQKGVDHPLTLEKTDNFSTFTIKPVTRSLSISQSASWSDTMALFVSPTRREQPRKHFNFAPANWSVSYTLSDIVTLHHGHDFFPTHSGLPASNDRENIASLECELRNPQIVCNEHQVNKLPNCNCVYRSQEDLRGDIAVQYDATFMPYAAVTVAPALHPQTVLNVDRWKANTDLWPLNNGFFSDWKKPIDENKAYYGNSYYCDFWRTPLGLGDNYDCELNHQWLVNDVSIATYPACGTEDYFNFLLGGNLRTIIGENLDAIYYDFGSYFRMCENDPALNGNAELQSWKYFNLRQFYKKLHERLQQEKPDTIIVAHTGGFPRFLETYVDFSLYGEGLPHEFCTADGPNKMSLCRASPELFQPDYLTLPDGFLKGMFYPRIGGRAMILPQIEGAIDAGCAPGSINTEQCIRAVKYQRILNGLTLVNDIPMWNGAGVYWEMAQKLQAIKRGIGDMRDVVVYPWWSNTNIAVRNNESLQVTLYVKQNESKALVVLFNPTDQENHGEITLDFNALNIPNVNYLYTDIEGGHGSPWYNGQHLNGSNIISVTVPPGDYRTIALIHD